MLHDPRDALLERLQAENASLHEENAALRGENAALHAKVEHLPAEIVALGIRAPAGEQVEAIGAYLKNTAAVDLTLVEFGSSGPTRRGILLIPGEQVNVNYELLRHGYAKLDTSDAEALRSFPELTAAAEQALETGTGFAREWKLDAEYVAEVSRARVG